MSQRRPSRPIRHRAVRIAAIVAVSALVAACGGGGSGGTTTATTTAPAATGVPATTTAPTTATAAPTTTVIPPPTATGIDPMADASTDPITVAPTSTETALMTDVRAARQEGYDRVVFVFRNVVPGYDVRYVERPVTADGSGAEVKVAGTSVVRVRMQPALDADLGQASAPPTYTGPKRFSPGTPEVAELVRTGGFEGVLTWAVGLNDRVDFRAFTLADPPRLVVDFRNH